MEDHRLKVFCAVAEKLNFSKAAEENYITQSAVSRIVKSLEDDLGVQLVHRQRGAISLTSIGKQFYKRAQQILRMYASTVKEVDELANSVKGFLSVGTSTTVARYLFPELIFQFREKYPMTRVHHVVKNTSAILDALIQGDIEVGLVEDRVYYPGVLSEKLCEDELVLVVGRKHPWAKIGRISTEQLLREPFIRREKGSGTRRMMENRLKEMGIKPSAMNAIITSANTDFIIEAVEKGLGTACVSKWAVRKKLSKGTLVSVQLGDGPLSRDFLIIRLDQELYTHVAQTFLNFLHESPPPSAP